MPGLSRAPSQQPRGQTPARHPEGREGNMDAMADTETSWGTTQVSGHYADLHRADCDPSLRSDLPDPMRSMA